MQVVSDSTQPGKNSHALEATSSRSRKERDLLKYICQVAKPDSRTGSYVCFPYSQEQLSAERIRSEFNKASETFRRCQKAATPMRMKCYEALLDQYSDNFNPETINESRRKAMIVRNKVLRSKFRDIRRVMKPTSSTSLSKVLIPC